MPRLQLLEYLIDKFNAAFSHRWAPLISVHVLISVFMFGFYARASVRSVFCAVEDDAHHCVREWVSATGGWAAVIVAVVTIGFLRKQIRSQQDQLRQEAIQHRETVKLMRTPLHATAQRAIIDAREILRDMEDLRGIAQCLVPFESSTDYTVFEAMMKARRIEMIVEGMLKRITSANFDRFEEQIGTAQPNQLQLSRQHINALKEQIAVIFDQLRAQRYSGEDRPRYLSNIDRPILTGLIKTTFYLHNIEQAALQFDFQEIVDWRKREVWYSNPDAP